MAAIGADQLAFAVEGAVLELADPDVTVAVLIAATAIELVVAKATRVLVAIGAVETAVAFEFAVDEFTAELVAAGIAALAFAVGFAMGVLALILAAVVEFDAAKAVVLIGLEAATVGQALLLRVPSPSRRPSLKPPT